MWVIIVLSVILAIIILRRVSNYSAIELYNDMKQGDMRTNAYVGYLQEGEVGMMTKPYSQIAGYSIPVEDMSIEYLFRDELDEYDYTKPVNYDYSKEKNN